MARRVEESLRLRFDWQRIETDERRTARKNSEMELHGTDGMRSGIAQKSADWQRKGIDQNR